MSDNKVERSTKAISEPNAGNYKLLTFFGDVKDEFGKITWTERDELLVYARIVVIATFILGLGIYFADLIIQGWLNGLSSIFRWIGG